MRKILQTNINSQLPLQNAIAREQERLAQWNFAGIETRIRSSTWFEPRWRFVLKTWFAEVSEGPRAQIQTVHPQIASFGRFVAQVHATIPQHLKFAPIPFSLAGKAG